MRLLLSVACLVPAVLFAFQSVMQAQLAHQPVQWNLVAFGSGDWLLLGALTPFIDFMARRFPLQREQWGEVLAAHMAGALGLCIAWASLGLVMGRLLHRFPADEPWTLSYGRWLLISLPYSVFLYFAVLGCVHAFTYFLEARQREAQASRLAAQLAEARLGALRMQMNPHFLFNSLNVVSVLVREQDGRGALHVLELLGAMLRKMLRLDQANTVPLGEELEFLQEYLTIEQIRYPDRLRVDWLIEERARGALIPCFLMQPLVENAIKHGVARSENAGHIQIDARVSEDQLLVSVRDDGVGMIPDSREGLGLSNTRARLRAVDENAALTIRSAPGQGTDVTFSLPFRVEAR